jgi:hypothetical protein
MSLPRSISFETDPRGGILQEWTCHGYLTALRALDLEIVSPERRFFAAAPADAGATTGGEISITCVEPVAERRSAWPSERSDADYAICILPHGRIPEHILASGILSRFDEVWVASAPLAAALACRLRIPVVQLLPVVNAGGYITSLRGSRTGEGRFTVAATLDLLELERNERPIAVLEAFKRAFERDDQAAMIIRCDGGEGCREGLERLRLEIGSYPVTVEAEPRGTEGALRLLSSADAYLSLGQLDETSIEIAHAMALGLPVVATGSPGNMEYMSPWNSFPVHVENGMTELSVHGSPLLLMPWEPSVEHAGRLLRYLYENREDAIVRGERARHDITTRHSVAAASTAIARRLETIAGIISSPKQPRAPLVPDAPVTRSADDLAERLQELETRMQEMAARDEELRRMLGDLRREPPAPARNPPTQRAEPVPPSRPFVPPPPVEQPRQQSTPQPPQNGAPPRETAPPAERQRDIPMPSRASEKPPADLPPIEPAPYEPDPLSAPPATAGQIDAATMVREARRAALSVTPFNSTLIVLSGGVDEYLQMEGRTAWHFPQTADGHYSDRLPDTATRAVNALEALRARGAHYLLIPASAFWWLSLFPGLDEHLEKNYRRIWEDGICIVYQLSDPTAAAPSGPEPSGKKWKIFNRRG